MLYAISNWIYGGEDLATTFERLQRYGYDGVELEGEPTRYSPSVVRALCRQFGLQVFSVAGIYPLQISVRDLSSRREDNRAGAVEYLWRLCDLAAEVAAPVVVVVPTLVGKVSPEGASASEALWQEAAGAEWRYAVESVRLAAVHAEEVGVVLAIEPVNRYETYLVNTARQAMRFVAEVDSKAVKIHLDTFHMNIEEADVPQAIRETGALLANVHIADNNRQAVGRGCFDFGSLMRALVDIEYGASLAMEPLPPVPNPYDAARFSRSALLQDQYAHECITRLRELETRARQE